MTPEQAQTLLNDYADQMGIARSMILPHVYRNWQTVGDDLQMAWLIFSKYDNERRAALLNKPVRPYQRPY